MIEAGEDLGLSLESGKAIRIRGERLGEDLQSYLPVQLGVGGLIDLSHAPLANEGSDIVMPESRSDLKGHRFVAG